MTASVAFPSYRPAATVAGKDVVAATVRHQRRSGQTRAHTATLAATALLQRTETGVGENVVRQVSGHIASIRSIHEIFEASSLTLYLNTGKCL